MESKENLLRVEKHGLSLVIENSKGSYKSFEIEDDPVWKDYPLSGVTYPVDYGYVEGYKSEDGHDLDIFLGSGDLDGFIRIWRYDTPIETKFVFGVTREEWDRIEEVFRPVIKESKIFSGGDERTSLLNEFKAVHE